MTIHFDEDAADLLVTACAGATTALRGQKLSRSTDRWSAMTDFQGPYAELFWDAGLVESEDRVRLAGSMEDLGRQVRTVQQEAERERKRRKDLAQWRERAEERERNSGFLRDIGDEVSSFFDPKPSTEPIGPTPISVVCRVRSRQRVSGGRFSGFSGLSGFAVKTSADPGRLRNFALSSGAGNTALEAVLQEFRLAWAGLWMGARGRRWNR